MKIRRETIVAIAVLAPTLGAYRTMHLAHNAFDATPCRQYHVRTRFREWRVDPATVYTYESRQQVLHGDHADGHRLVIRDDRSCHSHKYLLGGISHGKCIHWYNWGAISSRYIYSHGRMHGLCESWSTTGLIHERTHYMNGVQRGEHIIYDANGWVSKIIIHERRKYAPQLI